MLFKCVTSRSVFDLGRLFNDNHRPQEVLGGFLVKQASLAVQKSLNLLQYRSEALQFALEYAF